MRAGIVYLSATIESVSFAIGDGLRSTPYAMLNMASWRRFLVRG